MRMNLETEELLQSRRVAKEIGKLKEILILWIKMTTEKVHKEKKLDFVIIILLETCIVWELNKF